MKKIVILGAGITGLAAADRLLELGGAAVTVIDAHPYVGGLAATMRFGGVAGDLGPHRLYTELPEARQVWTRLLGDRLIRVRRKSRMLLAGRWIDYPLRSLQLLRVLGFGRTFHIATSLAMAKALSPLRGRPANFEQAMRRAFGAAAYRIAFESYTRKVWRTDPAELSAEIARLRLPDQGLVAAAARLLRRRSGGGPLRQFEYVRGGIGGLADALAERVKKAHGRVLLNSRVVAIHFGQTGATAVDIEQNGRRSGVDSDLVISTLPVPTVGALLPGGTIETRTALGGLEYLSLVLVYVILRRQHVGADHWLYFPDEMPSITRASEPKNFDATMAPPDRTCLCCEMTCRQNEPLWATSDETTAGRVVSEMSRIGLFRPDEILDAFVMREPWGYPIYMRDFEKSLEVLWAWFARIPNLIAVGRQGLYNHNNIDHCIVMGRRAAETAAQSPYPARDWHATLDQFSGFRIVD
jgi:protoporphyrinogen oxidase